MSHNLRELSDQTKTFSSIYPVVDVQEEAGLAGPGVVRERVVEREEVGRCDEGRDDDVVRYFVDQGGVSGFEYMTLGEIDSRKKRRQMWAEELRYREADRKQEESERVRARERAAEETRRREELIKRQVEREERLRVEERDRLVEKNNWMQQQVLAVKHADEERSRMIKRAEEQKRAVEASVEAEKAARATCSLCYSRGHQREVCPQAGARSSGARPLSAAFYVSMGQATGAFNSVWQRARDRGHDADATVLALMRALQDLQEATGAAIERESGSRPWMPKNGRDGGTSVEFFNVSAVSSPIAGQRIARINNFLTFGTSHRYSRIDVNATFSSNWGGSQITLSSVGMVSIMWLEIAPTTPSTPGYLRSFASGPGNSFLGSWCLMTTSSAGGASSAFASAAPNFGYISQTFGPVTVSAGDDLIIGANMEATGDISDVTVTLYGSITFYLATPVIGTVETAGSVDPLDVNVVGFQQQDYPLWATFVEPGQPVMNPPIMTREERNRRMHALTGNTSDEWDFSEVPTPDPSCVDYNRYALNQVRALESDPDRVVDLRRRVFGYFPQTGAIGCLLEFVRLGSLPDDNYFATLVGVIDDDPIPEEAPKKLKGPTPPVQTMKRVVGSGLVDADRPRKAPAGVKAEKSREEVKEQFGDVVSRLARRFAGKSEEALLAWALLRQPSPRLLSSVAHRLWGKDVDFTTHWAYWGVAALATGAAPCTFLGQLVTLESRLNEFTTEPEWNAFFTAQTGNPWYSDLSVLASEASAHNRLMHELNGNPRLAQSMIEVKASMSKKAVFDELRDAGPLRPWETMSALSSMPASLNPRGLDLPTMMPIAGDIQTAANAIVARQRLLPPEAMLFPRFVRAGPGAVLQASLIPLQPMSFAIIDFQPSAIIDTAFLADLFDKARQQATMLGRPDAVTSTGFSAIDIQIVARTGSYGGLSMQQGLLKLVMLLQIVSWGQDRLRLPLSGEVCVFDAYTQVDPIIANILTSANDFGGVIGVAENSGGNAALLPYGGGLTGHVYFHFSLQTVPDEDRQNVVFMPPSLTQSDANAGVSFYLFVVMWAEWPCLQWRVSVPTRDTAGNNPQQQDFNPFASQAYIPGLRELHIIIPRNTSVRNPTDAASAQASANVLPTTGPRASAGLNPNVAIQMNWVGGGLVGVNLAEYCYTWSLAVGHGQIVTYLQRLNDLLPIDAELQQAWSRANMANVRYCPLMVGDLRAVPAITPPFGTQNVSRSITSTMYAPASLVMANNFPFLPPSQANLEIYQLHPVSWNKVALTLCEASGMSRSMSPITALICREHSLYFAKLAARNMATVMSYFYSYQGWPQIMWNSAYTDNSMIKIRRLMKGLYAQGIVGMQPQGSLWGRKLYNAYCNLIDQNPIRDANGFWDADFICPPPAASLTILNAAGVPLTNLVPQILPDIWLYATMARVPRGFCSFPPNNTSMSTQGICGPKYATFQLGPDGGGAFFGPTVRDVTPRYGIGTDDTRDDEDDEIWNARIMHVVSPAAQLVNMQGNAVAASFGPGQFPGMMRRTEDYTMGALPNRWQFNTANTWSLPRVLPTGQLQFPVDTAANIAPTLRVLTEQTFALVETWMMNGITPSNPVPLSATGAGRSEWDDLLFAKPPELGGVKPSSDPPSGGGTL